MTEKLTARDYAALCWTEMSANSTFADLVEAVKCMTPHFERAIADAKERTRLPDTRLGLTLHFAIFAKASDAENAEVVEVDGYVTTGVYENGELGEFFIRVSKGMEALGSGTDAWAKAASIGLQFGVPLGLLCSKEIGTRFEPSGAVVGVEGIKRCTSPHDLIARWLLQTYGSPEDKARYGRQHEEVQS